jgi:cytochrome c oxidase cbb3-type subunit III
VRAAAVLAAGLVALTLTACQREQRRFSEPAPASGLHPGDAMTAMRVRDAARGDARGPYADNAWAISQGKQLYRAFNCVGCHANGGGGIGPALMDAEWIYGSAPWEVYTSIASGRSNGMPAYGGRVPDAQLWQLVAYVRSMSGLVRKDARPGRSDHMHVRSSEATTSREQPRPAPLPPAGLPR